VGRLGAAVTLCLAVGTRPSGPTTLCRSEAAVDAVAPLLKTTDPELLATIKQRFRSVETALQGYRQAGGYMPYTALTDADTKSLSDAVDALAQPVSEVAPAVVRG
jgi:iron uptake system component EfeO